jgi:hypothetical protein
MLRLHQSLQKNLAQRLNSGLTYLMGSFLSSGIVKTPSLLLD